MQITTMGKKTTENIILYTYYFTFSYYIIQAITNSSYNKLEVF